MLLPLDQSRAHNLSGMIAITFGQSMAGNRLANAVLGDLSVFATARVASGLPYTRLVNEANGQVGPPTRAGLTGNPAETINASRTPLEKRFDLRLVKGFRLFGRGVRVSADFLNPLGLVNHDVVWLETGGDENALYREDFIRGLMEQPTWDGDASFDAFDIRRESELKNPVNQYMILEAERRFGDGDGIFMVAEQRHMCTDFYKLLYGQQNFRESDRSLRLGFELVF